MSTENQTCIGHVKWFDNAKGYGFILGPQPKDVMVHYSEIQMEGYRQLREGEVVEYIAEFNPSSGWLAKHVKPLESDNQKLAA